MINLENYEDVASRIKRFREEYGTGRIVVDVISHDFKEGIILVEASVYRYAEDTLPAATDIALGIRDTYNPNMRKFYAEDTSTSAIGRAIGLLLGSDKRPTREDMGRVEEVTQTKESVRHSQSEASSVELQDVWTIEKTAADLIRETLGGVETHPEELCDHGKMELKKGTTQAGKPYYGFVCPKKVKEHNIWYTIGSNGRWQRPAHDGDR